MKKLFAIFAVAAMMTACNDGATSTPETPVDGAAAEAAAAQKAADSIAALPKDTTGGALNKMVEGAKEAGANVVEGAKDAGAKAVEGVKDAGAKVVEGAKEAGKDAANKVVESAKEAVKH